MTKKKGLMKYDYETHGEIPPYMRDYILEVSNAKRIEDVSVKSINDFLNGLEDWYNDVSIHYSNKRHN